MSSPVHDALSDLGAALQGIGDGWYLFGAQAALLRGSRRLTSDIDITLLPGDAQTPVIVSRLRQHGFALRVPDAEDFVRQTRVIPVVHETTGMPVDVVLGGPGLEQMFLDAAEPIDVSGLTLPVARADHLVIMKLLAGRPKDIEDAAAIVRGSEVDLSVVAPLVDAIAEGLGEDDIRDALERLREKL